jgi:hypothetical protein
MENWMTTKTRQIALDPNPKGKHKDAGGSNYDDWNDWLALIVSLALPINQNDEAAAIDAATAVMSGIFDMKPADPIEGILISQLMAANQASLAMYKRAWAQPPEYFEARMRYLALADKAARTVALLTERLDHHRGRGQQQIVVKHVTVNADQAVVTDSVVTNGPMSKNLSPALLTDAPEKPMQMRDEARQADRVPVGVGELRKRNEHQPHAQGPRCAKVQGPIKADREAVSCACGAGLSGLPDARSSRWRTGGKAKRKFPARWSHKRGNQRRAPD